MESDAVDDAELFGAIERSGARALLIGRGALVALGLPVVTSDYDFWLHIDDIELFNNGLTPLGLEPNRTAAEARQRGRYVLENGEHVDVIVARSVTALDGDCVTFDDLWARRETIRVGTANAYLPSIPDLIRTKRFAARPKDAEDIRQLQELREKTRG